MEETGTGHGIKIRHEWLGQHQTVEAHYNETDEHRLELIISDEVEDMKTKVYLTEEETGFFLAYMAGWYEQGGD